jgi:hypothetical protein
MLIVVRPNCLTLQSIAQICLIQADAIVALEFVLRDRTPIGLDCHHEFVLVAPHFDYGQKEEWKLMVVLDCGDVAVVVVVGREYFVDTESVLAWFSLICREVNVTRQWPFGTFLITKISKLENSRLLLLLLVSLSFH